RSDRAVLGHLFPRSYRAILSSLFLPGLVFFRSSGAALTLFFRPRPVFFRRRVPDGDAPAGAEERQLPPIGAPGERPSEARRVARSEWPFGSPGQSDNFLPTGRVPEQERPVRAGGSETLAVRAPGHRAHHVVNVLVGWAPVQGGNQLTGFHVPDRDR